MSHLISELFNKARSEDEKVSSNAITPIFIIPEAYLQLEEKSNIIPSSSSV